MTFLLCLLLEEIFQNLYYDKSLSNEQHSYLCFALAKSFEDMNNFSSAFRHYTEGNKLKKKFDGTPYLSKNKTLPTKM